MGSAIGINDERVDLEHMENHKGGIRFLLLDADGLLLKQARYFSTVYSEEFDVSQDVLMPFFKTVFRECQKGKLDLKKELGKVLDEWKWSGSVDQLLHYWFSSCMEVDASVLERIQRLRGEGVRCFLTSNQERYRGEYLKKDLGLERLLDGFFFSYELGYHKSEREFFETVLEELTAEPAKVLFLDNDEKNVAMAKSVGISAKVFSGLDDLTF